MQIGHHEADFLYMRLLRLKPCLDKMRPSNFCARRCDFGHALTASRFKSDKNIHIPSFLVVTP
jgi:hypothetical protein